MTELEKCYRLIRNCSKEENLSMIEKLRTPEDKEFWDELLTKINNGTSSRND